MQGRVASAKLEEENFSPNSPLLLHWDSKLLPDIHGSKTRTVDRVPVFNGNGTAKLLGVPKMNRGIEEAQASA